MASSRQDDSDWDKSTSEIQSDDSDDLFEARPNRWRGPPQSWRTLTEDDRLTFNALERLRNQDLSVHLYNAFALKHAVPRLPQLGNVSATTTGTKPWAPPKGWTAWPLSARLVPPDDFMKRTEDDDETFTFRNEEREAPSRQLEDVVSATILRCAKDKFRKRLLEGTQGLVHDGQVDDNGPVSSTDEDVSSEEESGGEDHEAKASAAKSRRARSKAVKDTYKPDIAIDDDVSYSLIRPSTRAILSKLDHTLTILHNARAMSSPSLLDVDSASYASDADDDLYDEAAPRTHRSRSRSRANSLSTPRASSTANPARSLSRDAPVSPTKPESNRGRKATFAPREGESERNFLRRRAKEQKKRLPVFSVDEDGGTTTDAGSNPRQKRAPRKKRKKKTSRTKDPEYWVQKKLDRFHLRDWSDVMGAAALAGFDARIIGRATQRCANLFGQGMEMLTIDEETEVERRRYTPGQVALSSESESEDEDNDTNERQQSHATSRRSSLAHSTAVSLTSAGEEDYDEHERSGIESPRKRQKRSNSQGSVFETCYCPHADCERAMRSFDRPYNLKRHLKKVHGERFDDQSSAPKVSTPPVSMSRAGKAKAKKVHTCTHADCERANRPFGQRHNLRRHIELVHGELLGLAVEEPPDIQKTAPEEPAAGDHFCPHVGCERATKGFTRGPNLMRHLKLVHEGENSEDQVTGPRKEPGTEATRKELPKEARRDMGSDKSGSTDDDNSTQSDSGSSGSSGSESDS